MIQLDLIGSLLASGILILGHALGRDIALAFAIAIIASVIWAKVRDWMAREACRQAMQERIDQLNNRENLT